jgi:hypothetical protein
MDHLLQMKYNLQAVPLPTMEEGAGPLSSITKYCCRHLQPYCAGFDGTTCIYYPQNSLQQNLDHPLYSVVLFLNQRYYKNSRLLLGFTQFSYKRT